VPTHLFDENKGSQPIAKNSQQKAGFSS